MAISTIVMIVTYSINIFLLILMIFVERKQPQTIFSWFVVLTLLPIVGFLLYLMFGGGLSIRVRLYIKRKKRYTQDYIKFVTWQRVNFDKKKEKNSQFDYAYNLIKFIKSSDNNIFSTGNSVKIFTCGEDKIKSLKEISRAEEQRKRNGEIGRKDNKRR